MKSGNSYYFSFCDNSSICKSDICIRKQTFLWDDYATMHHISSGRNPNTTLLYYTLLKNNTAGNFISSIIFLDIRLPYIFRKYIINITCQNNLTFVSFDV